MGNVAVNARVLGGSQSPWAIDESPDWLLRIIVEIGVYTNYASQPPGLGSE